LASQPLDHFCSSSAPNIAFAQSSRSRATLGTLSQPLGDPASGVPFGCRKCFPFARPNSEHFSNHKIVILNTTDDQTTTRIRPSCAGSGRLSGAPGSLNDFLARRSPTRTRPNFGGSGLFPGGAAGSGSLTTPRVRDLVILATRNISGVSGAAPKNKSRSNIAFAQSSMDLAARGPLSQPLGDCASAVPFGCRKCLPLHGSRFQHFPYTLQLNNQHRFSGSSQHRNWVLSGGPACST